jgi:hypothetical protein
MSRPSPEEYERLKRDLYEKISPRRRKFIDRMGYENWEPWAEPFHPADIRKDNITSKTAKDLVLEFLASRPEEEKNDPGYARPVKELAMGIVNKDERYRPVFEFCLWYLEQLRKEGKTLHWNR